ncbi:MAG TPA: YbaK/EbsC family protein [Candidatus Hydrogenedentes bacterium]|mgnify:CR=1 FL=1|jgi:Ala-tRNA(Pro) deacylase|nr:YbaK/EbsC family protein [Candidatus Hydrogenedentota bacterium]HPJ98321.1 YbaK/EbsC family protein [Candidatus Hydrogenedentota bacterium]
MREQKLKELLDREGIRYVTISHSTAYTAQEVAASAHVSGREMAKTVMVRLDDEMAMVVLPASRKLDFARLKESLGAHNVELAAEDEFRGLFPGCDAGAMPPFGNLYGVKVYIDENLSAEDRIAFNAGSHTEVIRMPYRDFARLVNPRVLSIAR